MKSQVSINFSNTALELNLFYSELLKSRLNQKPLLHKQNSASKLILRVSKKIDKILL